MTAKSTLGEEAGQQKGDPRELYCNFPGEWKGEVSRKRGAE